MERRAGTTVPFFSQAKYSLHCLPAYESRRPHGQAPLAGWRSSSLLFSEMPGGGKAGYTVYERSEAGGT